MREIVWTFRIGGIVILCEEEETTFVEPAVHSEATITAVELEFKAITNYFAKVFLNKVEIGRGAKRDCVLKTLDPSEYVWWSASHTDLDDFDMEIAMERAARRSFCRQAVKAAISDARSGFA